MAVTLLLGFITCMIMGPSPLFVGLQRYDLNYLLHAATFVFQHITGRNVLKV